MNLSRLLIAFAAGAAFLLADGSAIAQPKEKERKEQKEQKEHKEQGKTDAKEKKAKQHKHKNGKALLGERLKTNGKHKLEQHGKHTAYANVKDGKIAGVSVEADGRAVPVKKYKTNKKMAVASGMQAVSLHLAQAQSMGSTWIGYAYIDEWGDEVIYWYEYELIYDGDTGAVEYVPVY
jgi:hypothetical protein